MSHSILRVPNINHDISFMTSICLYNIGFHLVLSRGRSHPCLRHLGSREGRNRGPRRKLPIKLSSRLRVKQLQRDTNLQLL
jgi:predicted glycoside hydrolase/deacetylase ChbG (UPF0249 family)